ncbi:E3 ubiquitin-protein ligase E3D-like [Cylas formicarius]|uniref:E3 ubiquitin-protein ligase E3D-like n=1 Tax=Cylas formicarius TaxID=197179 RepID=UPI002958CE3A|nr:E3 ubiquitin-protein ligase E3D-like [Cylas formicarius]
MVYKIVVIEIRRKLQSANVFVTLLDSSLKDLNVILCEDHFQIVIGKQTVSIPLNAFKATPSTLASVKVVNGIVSFRFFLRNVDDNYFGSFSVELIKNKVDSFQLETEKYLSSGIDYNIKCNNCKKLLSNGGLCFKRVLPLPSDSLDYGDWFCHNHLSSSVDLSPGKFDVFFSDCYVHLNKVNLTQFTQEKNILLCRFCLYWIGCVHNFETVKLWFNTVQFSDRNSIRVTDPMSDVLKTIRNCFSRCILNTVKVILCYQRPRQNHYLLIWILEKNLDVIFNRVGQVEPKSVAKTLFKFIDREDDQQLRSWRLDNNVEMINVSKPMMVEILKHLHYYNRFFPLDFAQSSEFFVSYLLLYG